MRDERTLYIVVPCYNEEAVLPETSKRLREKLQDLTAQGKISTRSRVLFVNDGSKDRTWEIIAGLHAENPIFSGVASVQALSARSAISFSSILNCGVTRYWRIRG